MSFRPVQSGNSGDYPDDHFVRKPAPKRTREESGIEEPEATNQVGQKVIEANGHVLKEARPSYTPPQMNSSQSQGIRSSNSDEIPFTVELLTDEMVTTAPIAYRRFRPSSNVCSPQDDHNTENPPKLLRIAEQIKSFSLTCSKKEWLDIQRVKHVMQEFDKLICNDMEWERFIRHLKDNCGNEAASIIYHYGVLVCRAGLSIKLTSIQRLMECLSLQSNLASENIGLAFLGLGRIVRARCLSGVLDASIVNLVLLKLTHLQDKNAQTISRTLQGLGLLAQAENIDDVVDVELINDLLITLKNNQGFISPDDICSVVQGLRLLTQANELYELVQIRDVNFLLNALVRHRILNNIEIGELFYGFGVLAQAQSLDEAMDAKLIHMLLIQLKFGRDSSVNDFSNLFLGLRLLAQAKSLKGPIGAGAIHRLMSLEIEDDKDARNLLYAMGGLLQTRNLQGTLQASAINRLLTILTHANTFDTQEADIILDGLALLHRDKHIEGKIDRALIKSLIFKSSRFQVFLMMQNADDQSNFSLLPQELIQLISGMLMTEL